MAGAPITPARFAAEMESLWPWGAERRIAVAVSGGADSLCLAWLAAGWGRPFGLIVDHGLRSVSAEEAGLAVRRLAGMGVPSRVLTLRLAPGPALAARARAARYAALADAAASLGLTDLLLGHHASDQAETLLMREARGSGPTGLSGMAALSETPALRLVRPLLGMPPGRLRATLLAQGIAWTEDPSNADPKATRTRMRARLASDDALGPRLAADAALSGPRRALAEGEIAATLAARVSLFPEGHALLTPGPIAPACLAALLRALSGAVYPAGGAALARLAAEPGPATLGGIRLMQAGRLGAGLLLVREARAMQAPMPARDGAVWDDRFRLRAEADLPPGATLGPLGDDARTLRRQAALPSAVLRTLPALRAPDGALAVPHLDHFSGWTNRRVRLTLCPLSPAAGAPFRSAGLGDAQRASAPHVPG